MCNRGGPILGYVNIRSDPPSCASSGLVAVCDSTHTFPSLVVRGGIIKREGLGLAIGSTHLPGPNPEPTLENGDLRKWGCLGLGTYIGLGPINFGLDFGSELDLNICGPGCGSM